MSNYLMVQAEAALESLREARGITNAVTVTEQSELGQSILALELRLEERQARAQVFTS